MTKNLNPDEPSVNKDDSVATRQLQVWHLTGCISGLMCDSLTRAQKQEVSDITGAQYGRSVEHAMEYLAFINDNFQLLNILKSLVSGCVSFVIHFHADLWLSEKYVDDLSLVWAGSQLKRAGRSMGERGEIPFFRLQLCLWGSYGEKHMERVPYLVPFVHHS